ncbi:tryptophan synthase subunit alpha [Candidatus Micrarchaeota archaeon]|nr:tryptophan synthase subunit alpha [Candidatus Micrarchaeota archaeon]MBU2477353.1 tryptophan synthase subunit alpha [Candidatus Micrarchaeota archaeon]
MNRYEKKFLELKMKKEKAFVSFVVLGDPDYKTSIEIIKTIVKTGTDILELGIPFSDPIADGKTIQKAHQRALKKRMNTEKAFKLIKEIRKFTGIPIGLLVYFNNVYAYGINNFYRKAKKAGVDSVLITDLSLEESPPVIKAAKEYCLNQIFLVSQTTPIKRIKKINKLCSGFIYLVAIEGVTGTRKELQKETLKLIEKVKANTNLPLCIGFGISKPQQFRKLTETDIDGVIIGSKIVSMIEKNLNCKKTMMTEISFFTEKMKKCSKRFKNNTTHNNIRR